MTFSLNLQTITDMNRISTLQKECICLRIKMEIETVMKNEEIQVLKKESTSVAFICIWICV